MMRKRCRLVIALLTGIILLSLCRTELAQAFIQKHYKLKEVLDECTNVAFGTTESVDAKRQRAIVKLEENIKGKSEFSQIKINAAVGQRVKGTSPEMLISKFETGLPVIIFYQVVGNSLNGLGYVSGTWFQIFGDNQPDKDKIWWRFSHIEIHMHRTFAGTTEEFQSVVRAVLNGEAPVPAGDADVRVLALTGNGVKPSGNQSENVEFLTLRKFNKIGKWRVAYQATNNKDLSGLNDAQILWIGVDELGLDGYHLNKDTEDKIKNFAKNGGIVIVSSQDTDPGKICGNGWIPERVSGIDIQPSRDFEATSIAGDMFENPRLVKTGTVHLDDTWTEWSDKYKILATADGGKAIALATLKYGKGMYIVTALQNETEEYAKANAPLMENIMHFAVEETVKDNVKMLVLAGNGVRPVQGDMATVEFLALKKFNKVDGLYIAYQGTKDKGLSDLKDADILWIGVDEIGMDGYRLSKESEDKIKDFVKNGGVVIVSSQDSDSDKPYGNNWIPEPIKGVEEDARSDFEPTQNAGDIFAKPQSVKPGVVNFDDTWTEWNDKYKILATTNSGKNIALAMLEYGKGMYLVTALQNESAENVQANAPLMENIVHFSVKWLKSHSG